MITLRTAARTCPQQVQGRRAVARDVLLFTCICTFTTSEGTSQRLPVRSPRIAAAQKVNACGAPYKYRKR